MPLVATEAAPRPRSHQEALALFREGLPVVTGLAHGEGSLEALIRRVVLAIDRRDTNVVRALAVTRAEFAYLYYPKSPYVRPPTRQEAPLAWFLLIEGSQKGITRAFNRYGGRRLGYAGYSCAHSRKDSELTAWSACLVRFTIGPGDTLTTRLFGGVIERGGRYKILSYANDL
jgi:hypothetical protein